MGALVALTGVMPFYFPVYHNEYFSLVIDKDRMLKATPSPRLIFMGGSGLFSGLDGRLLDARLNINVVNLGFYAGFGILPYLDPLVHELKRGDVVVLVPEYKVMANGMEATARARPWLLALYPSHALKTAYPRNFAGLTIFFADIIDLIRSKLESFRKKNICWSYRPGFRKANQVMDTNGDLSVAGQFHRDSDGSLLEMGTVMPQAFPLEKAIDRLNHFYICARKKGARVYFTWPAYPEPELNLNRSQVVRLERDLLDKLDVPILGVPSDFSFPYHNFTNTVDHLDAEGKRLRTEKLIALLEKRGESFRGSP